jgi:PhnB protein
MQSNPYLFFNGQCEAAFTFYAQCLGGKIIEKMTYGQSPMADQASPELIDRIMHINLTIGDIVIMGADAPPEMFEQPQGFYVNLQFDHVAEAEKIYNALAENGMVRMPFQETFWAHRFAMLVDRFGTPWMINCTPAS